MYRMSPDAPELRGTLCGSFAPQYAARAQAPSQMSVYIWCGCVADIGAHMSALTASLEEKAMVTDVLTSSLAVCQKQMVQGSASSG